MPSLQHSQSSAVPWQQTRHFLQQQQQQQECNSNEGNREIELLRYIEPYG
jgi:hypothetical protein